MEINVCNGDTQNYQTNNSVTVKRFIIIFTLLSFFLFGQAQTDSIPTAPNDSVAVRTADLVNDLVIMQVNQNISERYKIYPTENIYILIQLDRQTGKLDLIQWSLKSKNEFTSTLNEIDLSLYYGLNSFELYPTKNMYQFILLDKATGRTWHVQWGTKASEKWIRRIF